MLLQLSGSKDLPKYAHVGTGSIKIKGKVTPIDNEPFIKETVLDNLIAQKEFFSKETPAFVPATGGDPELSVLLTEPSPKYSASLAE